MATPTKYTFSISTDTAYGLAEPVRLTDEIRRSPILIALDRIDTGGDVLDIWFRDVLSQADETFLAPIVNAHDGRPNAPPPLTVVPSLLPDNTFLVAAGAGDDPVAGTRFTGPAFRAESDVLGETIVEWSYIDPAWVLQGGLRVEGGEPGDELDFIVKAPATPVVPNATNTGNAHITNGRITPANGDGAFDIDLATAIPVPLFTPTGAWFYQMQLEGRGVFTPAPGGTGGNVDLYAVDIDLAAFARRLQLLGSMEPELGVQNRGAPQPLYTGWKTRVVLRNGGHAGLRISWWLMTARARTL